MPCEDKPACIGMPGGAGYSEVGIFVDGKGKERVEEKRGGWMPNLFTIIVVFWLLAFGYTFWIQQSHLNDVADDREVAAARLEEARARNEKLKKERDSMDKPEFVEKVAREELGMTRSGEMPYIAGKK